MKLLFFFLLPAFTCAAATMSYSCSAAGAGVSSPDVTASQCSASLNDLFSGGRSSASASIGMSTAPNGLIVSTTAQSIADANGGAGWSSSINAAVSDTLFTTGPARSGWMEVLTNSASASAYNGYSTATFNLAGAQFNCTSNPLSNFCGSVPAEWVPVTLGASYSFTGDVSSTSSGKNSSSNSSLIADVSFLFFESDRTTAVTLFDNATTAPEPASVALMLCGVCIALSLKRKSKLQF